MSTITVNANNGVAVTVSYTDARAIHTNVAGEIAALTEKVNVVADDWVVIEDSEDGNSKKKAKGGNLPGNGGGPGGGSNVSVNSTALANVDFTSDGDIAHTNTGGAITSNAKAGGKIVTKVATRTALKATATTFGEVLLTETGREGFFKWDASVTIAVHQADAAEEGIYVAPNVAADGAWVRTFKGRSQTGWWGDDLSEADTVSAANGHVLEIDKIMPIAASIALAAYLVFEGSGQLAVADTFTATIQKPYEAAHTQHVFDISAGGTVVSNEGALDGKFYSAHWGVIGADDGQPACQQALNSQIDAVTFGRPPGEMMLPNATNIPMGRPLEAFKLSGSTFLPVSPRINVVAGPNYVDNQKTAFSWTFTDKFLLAFQNVRNGRINGVHFDGPVNAAPTEVQIHTTASDWYNPGGLVRDNALSTGCAIAIDPFNAGVASGDQYPGFSSHYVGAFGTIGLIISECGFDGCHIAIADAVGGLASQGEDILIESCDSFRNKSFWVGGRDQNKSNVIRNCLINSTWRVFDAKTYGGGIGRVPAFVDPNINQARSLGVADTARAPLVFTRGYIESVGNAGYITGDHPVTFNDVELRFVNAQALGVPIQSVLLSCTAPFRYNGGSFVNYHGLRKNISLRVESAIFDGTLLSGVPLAFEQNEIEFRNCPMIYVGNGTKYGLSHQHRGPITSVADAASDPWAPPGAKVFDNVTGIEYAHLDYESEIILSSSVTVTVASNGTATIVDAAAAAKAQPNDILFAVTTAWTSTEPGFTGTDLRHSGIGRVISVVGSTINLVDVPEGFTTTAAVNLRSYPMPKFRQRCVGTLASGSATVTGLTVNAYKVDDKIKGAGIPAGTFVIAVDNGANELTLSQNATQSGEREIYDAKLTVVGEGTAPSTGTWFVGDRFRNTAPTLDGNGNVLSHWVWVGVGSAGAWQPQYIRNTSTPAGGGGGGLTDGDYGDVTVSGGGTVITIDAGAVDDGKIAAGVDAAKLADGSVSNTEFQYLGGVTSDIQTQLNSHQASIDALDQAFILQGTTWDASTGSFPGGGTAQAGYKYIVNTPGTVDGVAFNADDTITALVDNASTSTYAGNWHKADNTESVFSVAGKSGAVILAAADVGLGNVENTALSTWAGSGNITTVAEAAVTAHEAALGNLAPSQMTEAANKGTVTFVIDGGGSVITTGIKGDLEIPFACTINSVRMVSDQTGSIVVDIWKDTYANLPPTDAGSITASSVPAISSAIKSEDATLTGWTTSIAAGDWLRFNVDSVSSIQRLTISLEVTKT